MDRPVEKHCQSDACPHGFAPIGSPSAKEMRHNHNNENGDPGLLCDYLPEIAESDAYYDPAGNCFRCLTPPDENGACHGIAFAFESAEQAKRMFAGEELGYMYHGTSLGHPTVRAFEEMMTAGESGGRSGYDTLATASGMSALHLFYMQMKLMTGKDEIILCPAVYGGVFHHLVDHLQRAAGFTVHVVRDLRYPEAWTHYANERTIGIHIETPSNPRGDVLDIALCSQIAEKNHILCIVDNTVATYALQKPLELGAHAVINSVTKGVNGRTLCLGGTITARKELMSELRAEMGTGIRPVMDSRVAQTMLEGLRTLPDRMQKYSQNAIRLASFFASHPCVKSVQFSFLPLPGNNYSIARRQMSGGGGLLSFEVRGGEAEAWGVLNALRRVIHAPHIGHTDTLAIHPRTTTHSKVPPDLQDILGITESLIRVSAGIESDAGLERVKDDFDQALRKGVCA